MFKKSIATILSILMLASMFSIGVFADGNVDYEITNPYANVDWNSFNGYRASLHTHSNVSDGDDEIVAMIEKHYEIGYDILAMTDHGTVDRGWVDINYVPAIRTLTGGGILPPVGLTQERFDEISTGVGRDGQKMLRVPFGNELNAASPNNTHINSWFVDYGNGKLGAASDYETGLKGVDELGGISVINHPGEYTNQRDVYDPEKAYEGGVDNYYVKKFANLLVKYPTCLGIDINSKTDSRTKNERILWDNLLMSVVPEGRNVFAIATSDAHRFSAVDCAWTIFYMPENTEESLREAMETGAFFAGSMFIKNKKEILFLEEQLGSDSDFEYAIDGEEWEWIAEHTSDSDRIMHRAHPEPVVNNVIVDDAADTIKIDVDNAELVYWIADGKVIATGNEIDLNDYSDEIGSYVRAEIFGYGGVLYSQAFMLDYEGAPESVLQPVIDRGGIFGKIWNAIAQFLMTHPVLSKIWNWMTGND